MNPGTFPSMPTKPPPTGKYTGIGFADYRRWAAWNQSTLKLMGRYDSTLGDVFPAPWASPAHAHAHLMGQIEATESQKLGADYHAMLLEPRRFDAEYHVLHDKCDRRTSEGKARWARLCETFGEDRLIAPDRWQALKAMCDAAGKHPEIRNLIGAVGERETSLSWTDEETGMPCKARLDLLLKAPSGKVYVPDLKTTRCSHWTVFQKDAANFGYHVQAAFYCDGLEAATGKRPDDYLLIAQETDAPYTPVIYRMRPEELESGRRIYRAQLKEAARCVKSGKWPGYADDRIVDLVLPIWAHAEEPETIA